MTKLDELREFFLIDGATYDRRTPLPRDGFPDATDDVGCAAEVLALIVEAGRLDVELQRERAYLLAANSDGRAQAARIAELEAESAELDKQYTHYCRVRDLYHQAENACEIAEKRCAELEAENAAMRDRIESFGAAVDAADANAEYRAAGSPGIDRLRWWARYFREEANKP